MWCTYEGVQGNSTVCKIQKFSCMFLKTSCHSNNCKTQFLGLSKMKVCFENLQRELNTLKKSCTVVGPSQVQPSKQIWIYSKIDSLWICFLRSFAFKVLTMLAWIWWWGQKHICLETLFKNQSSKNIVLQQFVYDEACLAKTSQYLTYFPHMEQRFV